VPHSCCNAGGSLGSRPHVFSSHCVLLLTVVMAIVFESVLVSHNINCQISNVRCPLQKYTEGWAARTGLHNHPDNQSRASEMTCGGGGFMSCCCLLLLLLLLPPPLLLLFAS